MKVESVREMGSALRLGAVGFSAATTLAFAIGFSSEKYLPGLIGKVIGGQVLNVGLPTFCALIVAVFLSYLLAASKGHALLGSLLAMGCVAAMFACCQTTHQFYPSVSILVLALPAALHVVALQLSHQASRSEVVVEETNPAASLVVAPQAA